MDGRSEDEDGTSNATVPMILMLSSRGDIVVSVLISPIVCEYKNKNVLRRVAMFGWFAEC